MYAVSNNYLTAMLAPTRQHRLTGTIGTLAFTDADIVRDTFTVSGQCMDRSDIHYGGVFIGQLKMTVLPSFGIARSAWQGKVITPSIGLKVGASWEDVPLWIYTVAEAKWSATGVQIVAYDNMAKFDKAFPGIDVYQNLTPYQWLTTMCSLCGVTLGTTQAAIEAMPNGTEVLGIHKDNDIETWRDLLSWLAQALAGFATINRSGQLEIRKFGNPTGLTMTATERFAGASISDFSTHYTGVGLTLIDQNSYYYLGATPDDGETMKLGANPMLQHYLSTEINRKLTPILTELGNFEFTPFKSGLLGDVALDLGDVVTFTGGLADNDAACVMAYNYRFARSYTAEGYGDNPALADAKSKVSKSLSGIRSTVASQAKEIVKLQTVALLYLEPSETDTSVIEDGEERDVLTWYFAAEGNPSKIELVCTLELPITLTESQATVTIMYLINGAEEETLERVYVHDGKYILTLSYLMDVAMSAENTLIVRIGINGGSIGDDTTADHAIDHTWTELSSYTWNYAKSKLTDWGEEE